MYNTSRGIFPSFVDRVDREHQHYSIRSKNVVRLSVLEYLKSLPCNVNFEKFCNFLHLKNVKINIWYFVCYCTISTNLI